MHPSIEALLRGDPDALAHASSCGTCSSVIALAAPAGAPVAVDADLPELPVIDRALYTNVRLIDRGGMGQTSQARDRRLGRPVAIKELRDDLGDRNALARRLEREARLTARLQHPSIVGIYEAGRWSNGEPFYAMPLVRGKPLDAELRDRKTLVERLPLLRHVIAACEAIAYAHGQGVVHRDLKPANIMVGEFGETIVLDWGLAKALDEPSTELPIGLVGGTLTQHGVGTPQYMPPEQARGEAPTPRTDVYALGATLYHVLAGQPPYGSGDSGKLRERLLAGPTAPLRDIAPDVPAELAAIVDKAMMREPLLRFATARELADELERFQTGQLTQTHRYTVGELLRRFVRQHRVAVASGALAIVTIATVAGVAAVRVARERDRATEGEARAKAALATSQSSRASLLAASPTTRLDALALATSDRPQGLYDAVTAAPMIRPLVGTLSAVTFSRDGGRFAAIDAGHAVIVFDGKTGEELRRWSSELPNAYWLAWAPDGQSLAVSGLASSVELWDVSAGGARELAMPAATELIRFSDDGMLFAASIDGTVRVFRNGMPTADVALGCTPTTAAVASTMVWFGCTTGALVGWDGTSVRRWAQPDSITAIAAPENDLYTGSSSGIVRRWTAQGSPQTIWSDPTRPVSGLKAGATWLDIGVGASLFAARDGSDVVEEDIELASYQPVLASAPYVYGVAYADDTIAGLDSTKREVVVKLRGHQAFDRAVAVSSPDGTRVVSVTSSGEAWLWDAHLGALAGVLPGHDGEVVAIAASGSRVRTLAVNGQLHEIDVASGRLERSERIGSAITPVAIDGDKIAFGDAEGRVHVWGAPPRQVAQSPITAFAMRGDILAVGTVDGRVIGTDGSVLIDAPGDPVTGIAIAMDGEAGVAGKVTAKPVIASAHRSGAVRIGPRKLDGVAATHVLASPDGRSLAADHALVDVSTGQHEVLPGRALAWSSNGDLAIAGNSGALWLRRASGALHALQGHTQRVSVAMFTDGALWTGDESGEIRRWSIAMPWTVPLVITRHGEGAPLTLAAVDRWIVVGFSSGAVRVVAATLTAARDQRCAMLGRFGRPCSL